MNSILRKQLMDEKRNISLMGIQLFHGIDSEKAMYVSNSLNGIFSQIVPCNNSLPLNSVVMDSLYGLELFGTDIQDKVCQMLLKTNCKVAYRGQTMYSCFVTYDVDDDTGVVDKNSGQIFCYKTPEILDKVSPIYFGHEHVHSLKETNYQEYINAFRVGDVIPLFYELVSARGRYNKVFNEWLKSRMAILLESKESYDIARNMMKVHYKEKDLYRIFATRTGQYLNSFYYALILYRMYLENPNEILDMMRRVLNHEMTTLEMLNSLNLYGENNDSVFEAELDSLRKAL